jgi:hypothetical protein
MPVKTLRRYVAVCATAAAALTATAALGTTGAQADPDLPIHQDIAAHTHLAKLNQDLDANGTFDGTFDLGTGSVDGDLAFQPAQTTLNILGLNAASVGVSISPTAPAHGSIDLGASTISLTTSFDIKILYIRPLGLPFLNLVGNHCQTSTPVTLTSSGPIDIATQKATLSGDFTIPPLKNCGLLTTPVLNLVIPGPGNTFTASASPRA